MAKFVFVTGGVVSSIGKGIVAASLGTSALDAESESEVREGLNAAMKNRTVIVIAHRLATTQEADKIVVFDKGEIIEIGKHIDLLNKNGVYKELCEKQLIKKL